MRRRTGSLLHRDVPNALFLSHQSDRYCNPAAGVWRCETLVEVSIFGADALLPRSFRAEARAIAQGTKFQLRFKTLRLADPSRSGNKCLALASGAARWSIRPRTNNASLLVNGVHRP